MSKYLLRSMMFVPGHNERLLESAAKKDVDAVIIDLEDSVLPIKNKDIARKLSVSKLNEGIFNGKNVFVRVNKDNLREDMATYVGTQITGFVLPKTESYYDLVGIDHTLDFLENSAGLSRKPLKLIPLIETALGVLCVQKITDASNRVIALTFGREDYIADIEGIYQDSDLESAAFQVPRTMIVIAARAAGLIPVDTVYPNIDDLDGFSRFVCKSRQLGFEGTLILHPKQVPIAHQAYSPSQEELQEAQEVFDLAARAEAENKGVAYFDGKFIGPPLIKAAKKIMARNQLIQSRKC